MPTPASNSNAASDEKYNAIAKEYDERYQGPQWDLYDAVTLATAATHMPPPGAHVLDAGAGSGKFALKLIAKGYRLTLLDPSTEMLEVARRKITAQHPEAKAEFVTGTIEKMDFPDNQFDFVFCEGDPLSYCITTHKEAAREIVRVLKPGGGLYASLDNRYFAGLAMLASGRADMAWACLDGGKSFDPYGVPVHAFTPTELARVFEAAGASDVRVTGKVSLTHLLPPPVFENLIKDPATLQRVHELEIALAQDPTMGALAPHLHVVGRKPASAEARSS